jgi:hypothetical protein
VLDADHQPVHGEREGWLVGRSPTCDVSFRTSQNADYGKVSKSHAIIVATLQRDTTEGGGSMYRWDVIDLGSTNGTYLGTQPHLYRCSPGVPYAITDRAIIMFGAVVARVRVSYDIDDTQSGDDEPPTGWNKPTATADAHCAPRGQNSPWFVPDILEPAWVWFLIKNSLEQFGFLLVIGGLAALILYVLKL